MKPARAEAPPADAPTPKPQFHVCGTNDVPPTLTDPSDVTQYVTDKTGETYDRWKTALTGSSDPRARAVGLSLQRVDEFFAGSLAADTSLEQLIELATTVRDPVVYRIAVGSCNTGLANDTAPQCRRLSLSEWAKLDPDNAIPWLANAAAARNNGDSWAESEAFARASQAHKIDNYSDTTLSVALAGLPADATLLERVAAGVDLIGHEAAWTRPDLSEISRYCSATALQQSQIHDQCNALAELLVDHGGTLINFSLGSTVGKRVGWPAARLEQLTRERDTLRALLTPTVEEQWSCNTMAREDELLKRRGQIGELAALRELQAKQTAPTPPSR